MKKKTELIIINGFEIPAPDMGLQIIESTNLSAGRNANAAVVGQIVGRNIWKIEGLKWSSISKEDWILLKQALKPFFVPVTFTDDVGERQTLYMYPGDRKSQPMHVENLTYEQFSECSFNLIDCGW